MLSSGVVPAFHFALRHRYLRGAIRRCARDGVGPSTGKGPQANGTGAHRRAESVQLIARDACSPKPNEQLSPGRHVTMAIESVGTRGQSASASLLLERLVWVRLIAVTQPVSRRSVPMPCQCRPNAVPMVSWIAKCQFCHMLSMACRVVRVGCSELVQIPELQTSGSRRSTTTVSYTRTWTRARATRAASRRRQRVSQDLATGSRHDEVDHLTPLEDLTPLEVGGSNDLANQWPEAAEPRPGFHEKDQV